MSTHIVDSITSAIYHVLTYDNNNNNNNRDGNNNNNNNDNSHYNDNWRNRHGRNSDTPKATAVFFLTCVLSIFLLVILSHFFHLYVVRREPYYYSVQSDVDPTIWHVERIIPLREKLRRWRGRPRSDSDVFRDEDLERVRRSLMVRGWRGRVNSDGTPNKNHRIVDDRAAVGFAAGGVAGLGFGYGYGYNAGTGREGMDVEYGPRQYIETEDTPFWKERRWGHANYGTYGFGGGSPNDRRHIYGFGSPSTTGKRNPIPGLSSSQWPAGVITPEFGSVGKTSITGTGGYGLGAAFSYQASPRNTHFITPPIRASSKILESLNHTGLRYTTDQSARFPDEELQEHYKGLCENEDAALKELEDARTAAAAEHTYGVTREQQDKDHAKRVVEKLTELEKKLLSALKRKTLFAERFALREDMIEERGESSRNASVSEPPPPYTDIDENGLQFDEDNEASSSSSSTQRL